MPTPIYNTTGKDDEDYQQAVRANVMQGLKKPAPKGGKTQWDRVTRHEEDHEEG